MSVEGASFRIPHIKIPHASMTWNLVRIGSRKWRLSRGENECTVACHVWNGRPGISDLSAGYNRRFRNVFPALPSMPPPLLEIHVASTLLGIIYKYLSRVVEGASFRTVHTIFGVWKRVGNEPDLLPRTSVRRRLGQAFFV